MKQVLAMNLQLKAEMMKAEGAGGEPAPFGPEGVDVPGPDDATEESGSGGKRN